MLKVQFFIYFLYFNSNAILQLAILSSLMDVVAHFFILFCLDPCLLTQLTRRYSRQLIYSFQKTSLLLEHTPTPISGILPKQMVHLVMSLR
jgi:hypothetical protein